MAAPSWPGRRPARWSCAIRWSTRGGAFTLGLGLVNGLTVIPHANTWSHEKARRTFELAPAGCAVVGIDEQTALIRPADGDGPWEAGGSGHVAAWLAGKSIPLDQLP